MAASNEVVYGVPYPVEGDYETINGKRVSFATLNGTHVNDMANELIMQRYITNLGDKPNPILAWGPKLGNMFFC